MGRAFYDQSTACQEIYKRASAYLGFDVAALCFDGPLEELTKTEKCQPALFVTSIAAMAALYERAPSLRPLGVAGLSLGELTALTAADAIKFTDGLYLVQARSDAMAECTAHHRGAMLAVIGLAPDVIQAVCQESGAMAANYNTPEQVVLSGPVESIEQAERLAKEKGAKRAMKLEVAGAFHSSLMQPAASSFRRAIEKIRFHPLKFPVISNVTGMPIADDREIPDLLVRQIVSPVLWEPSMRYLIKAGAELFVEFPPARALTAMLRRIDSVPKTVALSEPADLSKLLQFSKIV